MTLHATQPIPTTYGSSPAYVAASRNSERSAWFPRIEEVTRPTVETAAAAYYMNRQQQTLRAWACFENGPMRPIRVHGRLAWPVCEIKRVMGVAA